MNYKSFKSYTYVQLVTSVQRLIMEDDNATVILTFKPEQFYPAIPLVWFLTSLEVFGSSVVISYLRSKPQLLQTVMDYANITVFTYLPIHSVLISIFITLVIQSLDYGEVIGSLIGYAIPASGDIAFIQICAIFIIQAKMVKNPEYLNSNTFESIVKCVMAVAIPIFNGVIYTYLYIVSKPTGFYLTLRHHDHHPMSYEWLVLRGCTYLPIGFASALNLMYTIRIQRQYFIQSNHILNARAVLVTMVGQFVLGVLIYVSKLFPDIISILMPMVLLIMKSVFVVTIVLSHNGVRARMAHLYIIRNFATLLSMRELRQIADETSLT